MEISYMPDAIKDRDFWKKSGNKSIIKKLLHFLIPSKQIPMKEQVNPNNLNMIFLVTGQEGLINSTLV